MTPAGAGPIIGGSVEQTLTSHTRRGALQRLVPPVNCRALRRLW